LKKATFIHSLKEVAKKGNFQRRRNHSIYDLRASRLGISKDEKEM